MIKESDFFYVFTNWGICKGHVVEIKDDLYKLKVCVDVEGESIDHDFWYSHPKLFKTFEDAIASEVNLHKRWK